MAKKKWADLTPQQKRAVYVGGAIETVITVAALRDLTRRPAAEIRGTKVTWVLAFFVQPFGPVAYLTLGRR